MTMDSSDGIRSVVLRRSSEAGLGFSIMGGAGYEFPPVIYGIEKDSPAARSGLLEAGDIILAINEREVVRLSTKEVLKCLRLSGDIVNIKYKRDPIVVRRVREFLDTPPSGIVLQSQHCIFTPTQVTITPSSPLKLISPYSGSSASSVPPISGTKPSKIRQPSVTSSSSPTRQFVVTASFSASPPLKKKHVDLSSVDESSITKGFGTNQITLSDDIFINHTQLQNQQQSNKSLIPIRSPPHSTNGEKNNGSSTSNIPSNNRIQLQQRNNATPLSTTGVSSSVTSVTRKNYETFVMTGDAILNVSKLRDDDSRIRTSPTKTTSKLTPLSHGSAPPHQIYSAPRPIRSVGVTSSNPTTVVVSSPSPIAIHDSGSESSELSPPLPPPPPETSTSNSSSTSDSITHITVKSDNLPPPPPSLMMMEDDVTAQSQSNGIAIAESAVPAVKENERSANNPNGGDSPGTNINIGFTSTTLVLEKTVVLKPPHHQNNEDTSISSSVMSDSGGEDGNDTDNLLAFEGEVKDSSKRLSLPSTKPSMETEVVGHVVKKEKERYNEYVLLNGSRQLSHGIDEEEEKEKYDVQSVKPEVMGYEKMNDSEEDEEIGVTGSDGDESTPPSTKRIRKLVSGESSCSGDSDGSDVESMRIAPVVKAVDLPSAERLAKRLYNLDGFKVSDVWRQLSKANDFTREVATAFLQYFDFKDETLDISLRKFVSVCPLRGETQERERVLNYFSARYVDCNPDFASQDAVHTLACALVLLNTDIYSGVRGERKMNCKDFVQNLNGLNDGHDFPEPILKKLYHAIKSKPLTSPQEEDDESAKEVLLLEPPAASSAKEYKRGYLRRKSIFEKDGKRTPLGKRSWKLFYCRLRELILSLSPDENSRGTALQNIPPLKLHHCLATIAMDYRKRPYVFSLTLADKSQFLFQSSDIREMHSWIDNLNLNTAKFSSPALDAPVGSSKKFEKPLLSSAISRLTSRDQLVTHQGQLAKWEEELDELKQVSSARRNVPSKREVKERTEFYKSEIQRYRTYIDVLERHLNDLNSAGGIDGSCEELVELQVLPNPPAVLIEMDENGS